MRSCIPVTEVTSGAIKCSPTNFPLPRLPGLSLHHPWAHVVLHLHHQTLAKAPGQGGTALVTWAARAPSCQAEEGRPCLAAVWAATARDPSALGRTPRFHERPARAPAFSLRNPALPNERLGHRGPRNSWAGPRESALALKTDHLHQQLQE